MRNKHYFQEPKQKYIKIDQSVMYTCITTTLPFNEQMVTNLPLDSRIRGKNFRMIEAMGKKFVRNTLSRFSSVSSSTGAPPPLIPALFSTPITLGNAPCFVILFVSLRRCCRSFSDVTSHFTRCTNFETFLLFASSSSESLSESFRNVPMTCSPLSAR